MITISHLITAHDETSLDGLLSKLIASDAPSEIVVLLDKPSKEVQTICDRYANKHYSRSGGFPFVKVYHHDLKKDYSAHKNAGNQFCNMEFVLQLDADEMPSDFLCGNELKELIVDNHSTELFWLPRANNFTGVTPEIATHWGWNIDNPRQWVNWNTGDYQGRLFRNLPHIQWAGKLHERIQGHSTFAFLPHSEEWALLHTKSITEAVETNLRYNREFSIQDNQGHNLL